MPIIILISFLFAACLAWYVYKLIKNKHRNEVYNRPLSNKQISLLETNVPLYKRLPSYHKNHLHGCIQVFLDEKEFVGQNILITEQIRLTIAANACVLLLHRQQLHFPGFKTIIIYPDTYVAKYKQQNDSLEYVQHSHRAGESWVRGPVVLSWGDAIRGSLNDKDGHNVVLHEFAHKLDELNGNMDGLPTLKHDDHYTEWAQVLNDEFTSLKYRAERGKNSVLDKYGTVSPPEFFAVATESFFEKPKQMQNKLPNLYKQLSLYYDIDPANW